MINAEIHYDIVLKCFVPKVVPQPWMPPTGVALTLPTHCELLQIFEDEVVQNSTPLDIHYIFYSLQIVARCVKWLCRLVFGIIMS